MGKFEGVLFATDLDDTLLDRSKNVSRENRQAIEYFRKEGGLWTYATGRSVQGFELPRRLLPESGPAILSNGSILYDYQQKKILFCCTMEDRCLQMMEEMTQLFPQVGVEIYTLTGVQSFQPGGPLSEAGVHVYRENQQIRRHLDRVGIGTACTWIHEPAEAPLPWIKGIFLDEPELLLQVAQVFQERYGETFELVFSDPHLLEMQDRAGNKGAGVARLASIMGIEEENVYVAGDQENDLAMLRRFSAFVPENGVDEAKKYAQWVVPDCDHHAIAHAIDLLDHRY